MKSFRNLFSLVVAASTCYASTDPLPPIDDQCLGPWFTGPLLAPAGHTIPPGYINIEPYVFYTVRTGFYDADWKTINLPNFTSANFQMIFYMGITNRLDIQIVPQATWNQTENVSSLEFNDFSAQLDFQLIENESTPSIPALKFYVRESFPTGRYERLDPEQRLTDSGGSGSFETTLGLVTTATHEFSGCHFFNWRLNGYVTLPTNVDVKGVSSYGGAPDTEGTISPGIVYGGIFAIQYNLTDHWAIAVDLEGLYGEATTFKGFSGEKAPATPIPVVLGNPKNASFSIAPAIEYNFNGHIGIIAGGWLTFAGRNTPQFYSGVLAINYYGPIKEGSARKFRTRGGSGGSAGGGGGR
ncbi:MAG: hypothetical protein P0S96_07535 [Simkaniaceae bacterium]|nr:hypothetical protein [Candidatus Sacchlamyda saccharinae]